MRSYNDYFYPGTGTLQNTLGIQDPDKLQEAEAALTAARMRQPIGPVALSPEGMQTIHRHIFQDVYPWAGKFRTVDMIKPTGPGQPDVTFAPGAHVERVEMPRFYRELRHDVEVGRAFDNLDARTFSYRASVYLADLNRIHPFPEGNGRTQRVFLEHLAARSGHTLDHRRIDRKGWIGASIESYGQAQFNQHGRMTELGRHEKMTACIEKAIVPPREREIGSRVDRLRERYAREQGAQRDRGGDRER